MFTQWSFLLSHGSAFFKIFETTDLVAFKSALSKHGFPKSKHLFQPQFQPGSIIHTLTSLSSFGFSTSLKNCFLCNFISARRTKLIQKRQNDTKEQILPLLTLLFVISTKIDDASRQNLQSAPPPSIKYASVTSLMRFIARFPVSEVSLCT